MTTNNYVEAKSFLETLFSRYFKDYDSYLELRFIGQDASSNFYRRGEMTEKDWADVIELNQTHHVYFGVNPRPLSKEKKQDDIRDIVTLWVDVDGKDFDGGKDEALRRVQGFPIAPSVIVDSGHGYHVYWVLTEPIINIEGEQRILLKQILAGVIKETSGDRSKVNLDALLRLPGTLNIKDSPPPPCQVVSSTDLTYRLEDFARFKDVAYVEPKAFMGDLPAFGIRTALIRSVDEKTAREDVGKLEVPSRTKDLIITGSMLDNGSDTSRSGRDFSIECTLIRGGYNYETLKSIFFNRFLGCSSRILSGGERDLQWDVWSALQKVEQRHSEAPHPSPARAAEERLQVRCAADIEPETTSWLWAERFPLGKLSLIVGDPESGKSLFCAWMAARVSSGVAWPDRAVPPAGKVIFLQCEDGVAETVVPRLIQYGADLTKVHFVDGVETTDGGDRMLSLLTDLKKLEDLIRRERDVRLVIIDPLQAYLGAGLSNKVNPHADAHIRAILTPVKTLAEVYNVAILGVVHLNKNSMADMMYRVGGSIALVGLPRSVWLLKWDRDPDGFRYFQSMKSNRRAGVSGLAFKIDRHTGDVTFDDSVAVPSAVDLLAASGDRRPREEAKAFLIDRLKNGERDAREILGEAEQEGINRATLFAAKKELRIRSERVSSIGRSGKWVWYPPARVEEDKPPADPKARIEAAKERVARAKTNNLQAAEPLTSEAILEVKSQEKVDKRAGQLDLKTAEAIKKLGERLRAKRNQAAQPST
jgi:putative DNA primase/helicase